MKEPLIDRIESKKVEKSRKLFLALGIVAIALLLIKLLTMTDIQKTSIGYWTDLILISGVPIYYLFISKTKLKDRTGQFIEWQSDKVLYKLKENIEPVEIELKLIKSIDIKLDLIEIKVDEKSYNLDISDFDKYEVRKRIKENFLKIKNCA